MYILALLAAVFAVTLSMPFDLAGNAASNDCGFPNGTDKALHYYMCSENEQFRIDNITVTDDKGNPTYPIDPRVENILYLYTYNYGAQIDDNKNNVKLYQYTRGWGSGPCAWSEMKTYGLLNNIDGCDFAHNCPLTHGDLVLILPLDLSQFAVIINAIAAYKPYQLEIRIYDYNVGSSHEEIACVMVQLEMS